MKRIIIGTAVILSGCVVQPARVYAPPQPYYPAAQPYPYPAAQPYPYPQQQTYAQPAQMEYQPPAPQPVVSIYVEPPLSQPAPVLIAWAPPPMLVESPPAMPYDGAVWTGGYWVWEGNWVWAHGRWAGPPRPGYGWVNPYYEHRNGSVVFVNGFWAAPGVTFAAPPAGISISVGIVAAGVIAGPRCNGPEGVFVPPPPGSHSGLIVPAPIGTAPAVVISAPPIVNPGMRIAAVNNSGGHVANVTIVAPPGATANGQAFNTSVPAQAHLAAAMTPVVRAYAPVPASGQPLPAYVAGRKPASLPAPQIVVHAVVAPPVNQPHPGLPVAAQRPVEQLNQQKPAAANPNQNHPAPAPQPQNKEKKTESEKKKELEHDR